MSHLIVFSYRGAFSASGAGATQASGYNATVTGILTVTLTHEEDGSATGTWRYAGDYVTTAGGSGPVEDHGAVRGTLSRLEFVSTNRTFVEGTGSLASNDTSLDVTFVWSFTGGAGIGVGTIAADPAAGRTEGTLGTPVADILVGTPGPDSFRGYAGNDNLQGDSGLDIASFSGSRVEYTQERVGDTWTIMGPDGIDTLTGIERLHFGQGKRALDVGPGQAAAETAKIIGAMYGKDALASHQDYVGIGLTLFDSGMTTSGVCELLVTWLQLSNTAFVNRVFSNIMGRAPTTSERNSFLAALEGPTKFLSQGEMLTLAIDTPLNLANIDLVGLQDQGVMYV